LDYYNVLFGNCTDLSYEALREIQPSELKAAYRKRFLKLIPTAHK